MSQKKNYTGSSHFSSSADYQKAESLCLAAQEDILVKCFGLTSFEVQNDGSICCTFKHRSKDDLSEETRACILKPENTPEENLRILMDARAQQRWYQKQRDETQAIPVDAGEKALAAAEASVG